MVNILYNHISMTNRNRRNSTYKQTAKLMAQNTLKAAFLSLLFSTFDECLMVLHLVQHAVKAKNGYNVNSTATKLFLLVRSS